MKVILDRGDKVSYYYDLTDTGNKFMFLQLINKYYPLEKTLEFLNQSPITFNWHAANMGFAKKAAEHETFAYITGDEHAVLKENGLIWIQ